MKRQSRVLALAVALALICGLTVPAYAAENQEIDATLSTDITVKYNGEAQSMADANGDPVYPILYNGTTYLPIRAVSNMLGVAVDWDQAAQAVLLADGGQTAAVAAKTAETPAVQTIEAQLSPSITVKYNGEVQTMKDASGNIVYPVSYQGTTYLPIRAVSNMLGIAVDWDQDTKTVLLNVENTDTNHTDTTTEPVKGEDITLLTSAGSITVNTGDEAGAYAAFQAAGISEEATKAILAQVNFITSDTLGGIQASADATVLGTNHIGYDYAEVDWSTASEGYIKVKVNIPLTEITTCSLKWYDGETTGGVGTIWYLKSTDWVTIPLLGGSADYGITIYPLYVEDNNDTSIYRNPLTARFTAEVKDPDAVWLMSHPKVDYENASNACAKALELTKNCTTDAEKITAIYNYVSSTIKYDYTLVAKEHARIAAGESRFDVEGERDLALDTILANKTGVCEHYAVLMAGMLRSLGIECKVACGNTIHDDGTTGRHAWVVVKCDSGTLNKTALGAGTDGDWIRLDPTNANNKTFTSNDAHYDVQYYY